MKGRIIPMLDARRMEVYCAVYNEVAELESPIEALVLDENSFASFADKTLHFLGDGSEKLKDITALKNVEFHEQMFPSAKDMSAIAYQKYKQKEFEDVAYFEPYYLKDFVAGKPKKLL